MIYNLKIRSEVIEKNQMKFESKLSSVRVEGNKSDKQLSKTENITKFYKSRQEVIKFYNDYFKMVHKAGYVVEQRKGLKILTPKQMVQRFLVALAQVQASSTSENVLNKIGQITYFFIEQKKLLKKYITINNKCETQNRYYIYQF